MIQAAAASMFRGQSKSSVVFQRPSIFVEAPPAKCYALSLTPRNSTISEIATGQQYRFIMPGPTLSDADCHLVLNMLEALDPFPELVVASGSLPPGVPVDFYGLIAFLVQLKGGRLIVDTSEQALKAAVEAGVYLIKPSLRELKHFHNRPLDHEADQEEAALRLIHAKKCQAVVVSLGPLGVLLATPDGCIRMRSPTCRSAAKSVRATAWLQASPLALARGYPLPHAVRFGVAAGAAAVMNPGTELCRREDTERLYERMAQEDAEFLGATPQAF
jgi:6-phosphofructokinase 2